MRIRVREETKDIEDKRERERRQKTLRIRVREETKNIEDKSERGDKRHRG